MDEWTYYVSLDGDYCGEYHTLEEAEDARLHERGYIYPKDRKIWRERVICEQIYPPVSDPSAKV